MKKLNLFKRIGAIATAVAMVASLGTTVAFAADPDVEINSVAINPTATADVYKVTVAYTATDLGNMGMTMLTYTGTGLNENGSTPFDSDSHTAVGINQWALAELTDTDAGTAGIQGSIEFNAKMTAGVTGLVMLGGDGVTAPAIASISTPWTATKAALVDDAGNAYVDGAISVTVERETLETVDSEFQAALKAEYDLIATSNDGAKKTGAIAWDNVTIGEPTATTTEADKAKGTHKATLTIKAGTALDNNGTLSSSAVTFTVFFNVAYEWFADTLTVAPETYQIYGDKLAAANKENIDAAVVEKVKAATITLTKAGTALTQTITGEVLDQITVTAPADSYDGSADVNSIVYTVSIANGTYGPEAKVEEDAATPLSTTVTVSYKTTSPVDPWRPTAATLSGAAISLSEVAVGTDNAALAASVEDIVQTRNANVTGTVGDGAASDVLALTNATVAYKSNEGSAYVFTVTIPVGTKGAANAEISGTAFTFDINATITFAEPDYVYGDVNGDGKINTKDHNDLGKYLAEWDGFTAETLNLGNADVNGDGKVNTKDHNDLAKHLAEWEGYETLPIK